MRKSNIPQQKFVFYGNDEKRDSEGNFDVLRSQKGICFKTEDNFGKTCNAKPATFISPEDSNCMDESQPSTKQRNVVLSRLILIISVGYLKKILLTMECRQRMNCVVPDV